MLVRDIKPSPCRWRTPSTAWAVTRTAWRWISPATNRPLETWISTVSLLNDNPTVISPAWPAR